MAKHDVYREYTESVTAKQAAWILYLIAGAFVAAEIGLRLMGSSLPRLNANSLHGSRTIVAQLDESPKPKIVAVGDSAMQGGGVPKESDTTMGMLRADLSPAIDVRNLSLPGGNNKTNVQVLQTLEKQGVKNIEQVIIQAIPHKFISDEKVETKGSDWGLVTANELLRFLPDAGLNSEWARTKTPSWSGALEARTQFELTKVSHLYRAQDALRNRTVGGYPSFWFAGKVIPKSLLSRIMGASPDGGNRFEAHPLDVPFDPTKAVESDKPIYFVPRGEMDAMADAIKIAKRISSKQPVVLIEPMHYEFDRISDRQRQMTLTALDEMEQAMQELCEREGATLVWIDSKRFQQPELWTRTLAHFQPELHREIYNQMRPAIAD